MNTRQPFLQSYLSFPSPQCLTVSLSHFLLTSPTHMPHLLFSTPHLHVLNSLHAFTSPHTHAMRRHVRLPPLGFFCLSYPFPIISKFYIFFDHYYRPLSSPTICGASATTVNHFSSSGSHTESHIVLTLFLRFNLIHAFFTYY